MNELDLFAEAIGIADPAERAALLDRECAGRPELRQRIDQLLNAHVQSNAPLDQPPVGMQTADYTPIAERIGTQIGPYILREQIGEGGFGLVFVAEQQEPVKRKVALKVIKPGMDSRQVVARFEAERQALALMDHPNIARVLDAGATDTGRPYFVMELVRGIPITEYCDKNQLPTRERLDLFVTVCQAIQHAHQKGIIHRDVKPSNVLVTSHDGKPVAKVIDFGVAKAISQQLTDRSIYTNFAQMIGTPLYMSPEQAEMSGLDIDTRSDIYSLGVLLYELLTGTTPLEKKRIAKAAYDEIRRMIREEEPKKPSTRLSTSESIASVAAQRHTEPTKLSKLVRGDLDWITMKALEKDRTRRYETANGLARDIQRYLSDEPVEACPPSATYRLRKFAKKNRAALTTAGAIALLLTGGVAVSAWQAVRATRAERDALAAQQAETKRAEGERQAKEQAEIRRLEAETNLRYARKGNEILGSVFTGLDPKANYETIAELRDALKLNLANAVRELEGEAVGDRLVVAGLQDRLGLSLLGLGYPADAIPLFVKTRATREEHLGADDPLTLASAHNLGKGYLYSGRFELALPLLQDTMRLRNARLGPNHVDTLASMAVLAKGYSDAGQLDQALPLLEETLKLRKASLGADDPDTLASMSGLAWGYREAGKPDLALPLWEEVHKLRKARQGATNPATLKSMGMLGLAYQDVGKPELALPLLDETVRLMKVRLGPDHPETLSAMNNLAVCYTYTGKPDLAIPLLDAVLALGKPRQGAGHHETLTTLNNLAKAHHDAGQLDRALTLFVEARQIIQAELTADHPLALTTTNNLAKAYQDVGRLDLALPLFEQAAAGVEKRQFRHDKARRIMLNTIAGYELAKNFATAESWRRKWLDHIKEKLGSQSLAYADELTGLGENLRQQQKHAEAEAVLRDCLAIRDKKEPDDWRTFNTQSMLGGAILGQKKYAEAEPLLLKGYERMKERETTFPPTVATRIPEAIDRLIDLYTETNEPDKVKKWQAERAKYPDSKPADKK
jgi:serine/threonine protein kinase/tetratricopeptide (TPR) repeat protein